MPRTSRDPLSPRLCELIQGVEFWIVLTRGRMVRCVIAESALQAHYGAEPDDPLSWLLAFARHRLDIERHALGATGRRDDVHVVLLNDSAGRLRFAVARCEQ